MYILRVPEAPAALSLDDTNEHTSDIEFPAPHGSKLQGPFLNGSIAIGFKAKKTGSGTNSTGLTVTARALIKDPESGTLVAAGNAALTIVAALDWTDDAVYSYPLVYALGPCVGVRLGFTYASGGTGTPAETMDVVPFIDYE